MMTENASNDRVCDLCHEVPRRGRDWKEEGRCHAMQHSPQSGSLRGPACPSGGQMRPGAGGQSCWGRACPPRLPPRGPAGVLPGGEGVHTLFFRIAPVDGGCLGTGPQGLRLVHLPNRRPEVFLPTLGNWGMCCEKKGRAVKGKAP